MKKLQCLIIMMYLTLKILNVSENYDLSQLKVAYKKVILQTHPTWW